MLIQFNALTKVTPVFPFEMQIILITLSWLMLVDPIKESSCKGTCTVYRDIQQLTQSMTECLCFVRASEQNLIPGPNVESHFPGNHYCEKAL